MSKLFSPAVSVIVPVFNAEKYLGACLESIAAQTFTDFEVIVVDDCSTDNSTAVAEKFFERFDGRLKIISLDENTGNPSTPRNEGLNFSRGEYIFFMDNDDLLTPNALATFFDAAETFQADVVYTERAWLCDEAENISVTSLDKKISPVAEPTLETENFSERVENFLRTDYGWAPWSKFLRRDFLLANKIFFPHVKISEDVLWSFKVTCLAENFLRLPTPLYICRTVKNSWSRVEREPADEIKFWLDPLCKGLDYLDDFMDEINFFAQNPNYRFDVTNFFVKMQVAGMLDALEKLSRVDLYEIIHREFSANGGRHAALIANLFVFMNFYIRKCG